jgi:hypothetical protein
MRSIVLAHLLNSLEHLPPAPLNRGMTEIAPLGTIGGVKGSLYHLGPEQRVDLKTKQGRPHVLCDMRIVDDEGKVRLGAHS